MKVLIAEDDLASRKFLSKFLSQYGEVDSTVDGLEAVEAFKISLDINDPYQLICLDIMMPKIDGVKALKAIRDIEKKNNVPKEKAAKIVMTSALNEAEIIMDTFDSGSEAYANKPINTERFVEVMRKLGLIE